MSEEIDNAAINVPRAMLTTMILNGATGYAMVLAVLFSHGDIKSIIVGYLTQESCVNSNDSAGRTRQLDSLSFRSSITGPDLMQGQQL